jgi:hypothetical protein
VSRLNCGSFSSLHASAPEKHPKKRKVSNFHQKLFYGKPAPALLPLRAEVHTNTHQHTLHHSTPPQPHCTGAVCSISILFLLLHSSVSG